MWAARNEPIVRGRERPGSNLKGGDGQERTSPAPVTPPRREALDSGKLGWEEEGAPGESFEYSVRDAHPEVGRFSHASRRDAQCEITRLVETCGPVGLIPLGALTRHEEAEILEMAAEA
jgi:hypothetical protein